MLYATEWANNIKDAGTFTTCKPLSSAAGVVPDCELVDKVVTEIGEFPTVIGETVTEIGVLLSTDNIDIIFLKARLLRNNFLQPRLVYL
jgi:hypothetical protein